ncbi:hypothetical protein BH11PLA1_BH11PLA1_15900 [soil metagenome]
MPRAITETNILSGLRTAIVVAASLSCAFAAGCEERKAPAPMTGAPSPAPAGAPAATPAPAALPGAPMKGGAAPMSGAAPAVNAGAPGLAVGTAAPDAVVTGMDGKPVALASLYKNGPVVLTFYRGGWCPFCNKALAAWGPKIDELKAAGGTFIAVTPEKAANAEQTRDKAHADYAVYSDGALAAAKAFRVHFAVDDATKAKYEKFGLDVGASNQSGTWELPAPATFVIDRAGVIRWAFADWDYKQRADPADVIAAVKQITKKE